MTTPNPLIVPVIVEAMVANDMVRSSPEANSNITFWRTTMNYPGMRLYRSAEPSGTTGNDPDFDQVGQQGGNNWSTFYNGVYLKWRLPDALRRGEQDGVKGTTSFPLVPNRWLVIRVAGLADAGGAPATRTATAWIVQSDYQASAMPATVESYADLSSPYWAQTASGAPGIVLLGQITPLTASWTEPGTPMFLTAVAAGNPAFSISQTDCNNVFSMFDPLALDGVADQTVLSYQVIGWYSDPTQDPLAGATADSFATILASLGWGLPDKTDPTSVAVTSVYSGFLGGILWQTETAPVAGPPSGIPPTVAIGGTSVEALAALLTMEAADDVPPPSPPLDPQLLEAFQYDLLSDYDQPDGPALVAEKLHSAGFQHVAGGYGWQIVDAPGNWPALAPAELAKEAQWLATLNQRQAAFDQAQRKLAALQDELYVMWWKWAGWSHNTPVNPPPGLNQHAIGNQLNPTIKGSLAAQVQAQMTTLAQLAMQIPQGATQPQLTAAIAAYSGKQNLPPSRQLKRFAQPRFALPNPPVLMVSGAGAAGIYNPQGQLVCRFSDQLVTGFVDTTYSPEPITSSTPKLVIPVPSVVMAEGGPSAAVVQSLIVEAFFLDPSNASLVAEALSASPPSAAMIAEIAATMRDWSNARPVPPPVAGTIWQGRNPWRPLFLYWNATLVPIPFGTPSQPNWRFNGNSYDWNGASVSPLEIGLDGRILLTPQATLNMQAQIRKFLASNPNLPDAASFQALLDFIGAHDGVKGSADPDGAPWDLLSQALTGFNEQLLQREAGVFPSPNASSPAPVPFYGSAPGFPPASSATGDFQPWRAGQFYFTQLMIVDEWGQSLTIVDADNFRQAAIARPLNMTPSVPIKGLPVNSIAALPPALLQPARLDFDLVSGISDSAVAGLAASVNPICGWIIPNHLDHSLMAYDSTGKALGELSVGALASGPAVVWTAVPGGSATIPAIPHFGAFLTALLRGSVTDFRDFLAGVDETLWTTVPPGAMLYNDLAILIGRPLAFVWARLTLELDGPPAIDPSWPYTFAPVAPALPTYPFAIELGNLRQIDDGLVGYFVGDNYSRFNIVAEADAHAGGFLQPIGANNNYIFATFHTAPFAPSAATYVSMLVDPRAPVHATTGILPVVQVALPPADVAAALAMINVTFRVGPVLTDQSLTAGAARPTILMPLPSEKSGQWSWQQQDPAVDGPSAASSPVWTTYPVAPTTPQANLSTVTPVLRRGMLQLSKPLD